MRAAGDKKLDAEAPVISCEILGEKDVFARTYAAYLDLPRRPESLDALLSKAASRR